jgi:hypothetical protein
MRLVLATINAKYTHASFGLRCLKANLGPFADATPLLEFTSTERPSDIIERLLQHEPTVLGLGVYVWNAQLTLEVVRGLKKLRPALVVVLGGPEVSHEPDAQELVTLADYVIAGEGEVALRTLVEALARGERPATKCIDGGKPSLSQLASPYPLYSADDLQHRVVYVEASRGCPYTCEFCLSALDDGVRTFPLEPFLAELQLLLDRGLRQFKFVDRTFNLKLDFSLAILRFFRARLELGLFLHFEMIPDRLPQALRDELALFPPGVVQLELGVQTLNPAVGALIRRKQDVAKLSDNLRFLRAHTGVHLHADLIVGLPGETLESFGRGFDALFALGPHEIQVGVLKRLRGAPIARHTQSHAMLYADTAPYEVLQTAALSFADVQRLKRFARYFDLVVNNGRFPKTSALLLGGESAFSSFLAFSDWLWAETKATHGISLPRLAKLLERYLGSAAVATALEEDLGRAQLPVESLGHARRQVRHGHPSPRPSPPRGERETGELRAPHPDPLPAHAGRGREESYE